MSQSRIKAVPYVLKDHYLQVTIKGQPFALDDTHPTFVRMRNAIKKKNWKVLPKLVTLAQSLMHEVEGAVKMEKGVIYYKDKAVDVALTQRILEMVRHGAKVKHMLRFMDNLYQNPSEQARRSFYQWLEDNGLPITDDGCFLAYKSVDNDYLDTFSRKVSNKLGQIIMMARKVANNDYDTQCSTGFHVCSRQYGLYGNRVLAVKVNPKHILSAVEGKMRVTQYEVLMDLGTSYKDFDPTFFTSKGLSQIEGKIVVEVKKERQEMIKMLLKANAVRNAIRRKKITKTSIVKSSYARLKSMVQRYGMVPKVGPEDKRFLQRARQAAGLTPGQIAKQLGVGLKSIYNLEKKENPSQQEVDNYLVAITKLTHSYSSAVTYPKPVKAVGAQA